MTESPRITNSGTGPPSSLSAIARVSLLFAETQAALGRSESAIALMAEVVAKREDALGPDHPFTVAGRELLSNFRSGRWCPPQSRSVTGH